MNSQIDFPQIIDAAELANEASGILGCIIGRSGIGKTSQLLTLPPDRTLFCDFEAGTLSVKRRWKGRTIKLRSWQHCRDIAAILGGANPDRQSNQAYSAAHYAKVGMHKSAFDKYNIIFMDSITAIVRMCFQWCKSQPSVNRSGQCDTRASYGLLGEEMTEWILQLRLGCNKHIWFTAHLDEKTDEFNRQIHSLQMSGNKVPLEFFATMDIAVTMAEVPNAHNKLVRAFICHTINEPKYPAKDRSSYLSPIEEANLGKLTRKILAQEAIAASGSVGGTASGTAGNAADSEVRPGLPVADSNLTTNNVTTNTTTTNTNQPSTINKVSI